MTNSSVEFTPCQKVALRYLEGEENLFLTGGAGTGKSFIIEHFLRTRDHKTTPILASTGAAAILVGGRTFHGFFGLGIMEGGPTAVLEKAMKNRLLKKRLKEAQTIIIDEVSMISGTAFRTAEKIARTLRASSAPWGGIRIVAVGDFSQLPPVTPGRAEADWAFMDDAWRNTLFDPVILNTFMRTRDEEFLSILNRVRKGILDRDVQVFLQNRTGPVDAAFEGTRLFPRRDRVENYNLERLGELPGKGISYATEYVGVTERGKEDVKRLAPVPEVLQLKEGALVMFRQNDQERRWVNGSLGWVQDLSEDKLTVRLMRGRKDLEVGKVDFSLLDSDDKVIGTAKNFPLNLAYASTIHKAQGATLDQMAVDLRGAWEHGQSYVALSRVRTSEGLRLEGWNPRAIQVDPRVLQFHQQIGVI